jgi:hypothetical protein
VPENFLLYCCFFFCVLCATPSLSWSDVSSFIHFSFLCHQMLTRQFTSLEKELLRSLNHSYMIIWVFSHFMTLLKTFHHTPSHTYLMLFTHSPHSFLFLFLFISFICVHNHSYIYSMGFCILVIYGVQLLYENIRHSNKMRWILQASGFMLLCFFCLKTITRNQDWQSRESLLKWVIYFWCMTYQISHKYTKSSRI